MAYRCDALGYYEVFDRAKNESPDNILESTEEACPSSFLVKKSFGTYPLLGKFQNTLLFRLENTR
jgi:hypothetical protein